MIKNIGKRLIAFILIFALIGGFLPIVPTNVQAAEKSLTLSNNKIGVTYNGGTWSAENDVIKGSVTGEGGRCASSERGTLTITNTLPVKATLKFEISKITLNNGAVTVDGKSASIGLQSIEVEPKKSVTIMLESAKAASTTSIELKNFALIADVDSEITFEVPTHGQMTVNTEAITSQKTLTVNGQDSLTLKAEAEEGYKFISWIFNGKIASNQANLQQSFYEKTTVEARFAPKNAAVFKVGEVIFDDLNQAVTYAV